MVHSNSEMIDENVVPGTFHLVNLEHNMATKHSKGNKEIVLIPNPSDDPDDPLNWSPRRKALSTFCLAVYVIFNSPCLHILTSSVDTLGSSVLQDLWSILSWCRSRTQLA